MKKHSPAEQALINDGRDLLCQLAESNRPQRKSMFRSLIGFYLGRLEKEKGIETDAFFLNHVFPAAVAKLSGEEAFEEAHAVLDEIGTLENLDGTRVASDPAVCLQLSTMRKTLNAIQHGPNESETPAASARASNVK